MARSAFQTNKNLIVIPSAVLVDHGAPGMVLRFFAAQGSESILPSSLAVSAVPDMQSDRDQNVTSCNVRYDSEPSPMASRKGKITASAYNSTICIKNTNVVRRVLVHSSAIRRESSR